VEIPKPERFIHFDAGGGGGKEAGKGHHVPKSLKNSGKRASGLLGGRIFLPSWGMLEGEQKKTSLLVAEKRPVQRKTGKLTAKGYVWEAAEGVGGLPIK